MIQGLLQGLESKQRRRKKPNPRNKHILLENKTIATLATESQKQGTKKGQKRGQEQKPFKKLEQ
jgi:hypothetical protein